MRRALCALAFVLAATPALADPPEGELNASPGALASGLIGDANAEGVFEIVPDEHLIAVRHSGSGLVCRLDPSHANRLVIFPRAARGEDVACDSEDGREFVTLYATRFSIEATLDEQIEGVEAAIRQRFPDARALPAPAASAASSLRSRSVQFLVTRDGAPLYTRASLATVGQWTIKMRYTAQAPDAAAARAAEDASSRLWAVTLAEIAAEHS